MNNKEKEFHKSRLMFAVVNNKLEYTTNNELGHAEWLEKDFGIDNTEFEHIVRGYCKNQSDKSVNIVMYIGKEFKEAILEIEHIKELKNIVKDMYKPYVINIYSGVKIGEVGSEWKPITYIGSEYTDKFTSTMNNKESCERALKHIELYYQNKTNSMFDYFYCNELDFFELCVKEALKKATSNKNEE